MVDFYGFHVGKYTVRPMDTMDITFGHLSIISELYKDVLMLHTGTLPTDTKLYNYNHCLKGILIPWLMK